MGQHSDWHWLHQFHLLHKHYPLRPDVHQQLKVQQVRHHALTIYPTKFDLIVRSNHWQKMTVDVELHIAIVHKSFHVLFA